MYLGVRHVMLQAGSTSSRGDAGLICAAGRAVAALPARSHQGLWHFSSPTGAGRAAGVHSSPGEPPGFG